MSPANRALKTLAAWLQQAGTPLCAYRELVELVQAAGAGVHVLMQCDVDCPEARIAPVLTPGGVHFHLKEGSGKYLEAWQKPLVPSDGDHASHAMPDSLRLLERRRGSDTGHRRTCESVGDTTPDAHDA